ncbi:MAG: ATP-dependent sacrificial sulfur transferase LarE, partial [Clostridiales Family XIII bacterium]|nr:ATP-dependent sacrificial sulfur transferase LarE [Clostridiales Family XIII bacterium]
MENISCACAEHSCEESEKALAEAARARRHEKLCRLLSEQSGVAVAFSGGVDSTFLLRTAKRILGDKVIAVTARSCSFPQRELDEAKAFCAAEGIRHFVCDSEELDIEGFSENPVNRCYLCKNELFTKIWAVARANGIAAVIEGSNADDAGDYRPGLQAVREQGVLSPLREAGLDKADIRALSKAEGLSTWNKQSFACLSSRFVYGETITEKKLGMVDKAEQLLLDEGFTQVRVRVHGDIARIELDPGEFPKLLADETRERIYARFKEIGFSYTGLDLLGYRTGSMNETL